MKDVEKILNNLIKHKLRNIGGSKRNNQSGNNEAVRKDLVNFFQILTKGQVQAQLKTDDEVPPHISKFHPRIAEDKNSHKHEESSLHDHWSEAQHSHVHDVGKLYLHTTQSVIV